MKWRRSKNGINGILEDEVWVEDPVLVKKKVKEFFETRFKKEENFQVRLDNIPFKIL